MHVCVCVCAFIFKRTKQKSSREKVLKIVDNCGTILFVIVLLFLVGSLWFYNGFTRNCNLSSLITYVRIFFGYLLKCSHFFCLSVICGDLTVKMVKRTISQRNYQSPLFAVTCFFLLLVLSIWFGEFSILRNQLYEK